MKKCTSALALYLLVGPALTPTAMAQSTSPAILAASAVAQPQGSSNSSAAPPLSHYYCGSDAKENWNLSCKITRNTVRTNSSDSGPWADPFRDIQTITVCLAFDNRGGLHEDTVTVLYTTKDGSNSTPLTFFDTIKYASNMTTGNFSWVGTFTTQRFPVQ
jgi:hypothetical protein